MVESNLQRTTILPSEKAFSYKMRLEAMKRQVGRPSKENASPVATNSRKVDLTLNLENRLVKAKIRYGGISVLPTSSRLCLTWWIPEKSLSGPPWSFPI